MSSPCCQFRFLFAYALAISPGERQLNDSDSQNPKENQHHKAMNGNTPKQHALRHNVCRAKRIFVSVA
jgi:hypothetical protein